MLLNEKTLELTVTHELVNLIDMPTRMIRELFLSMLYYRGVRRVPADLWAVAAAQSTSAVVTGLTQSEERVNGYDLSINVPAHIYGVPRVLLIQYKCGIRRRYIVNRPIRFAGAASMFFSRGGRNPLNPVMVFKINKNTGNDQHDCLMAASANGQGDPFYALPLYHNAADHCANLGQLLLFTAFVPASAVDAAIRRSAGIAAGVPIRNVHSLHHSYNHHGAWEVCSKPTAPEEPIDAMGSLIGELLAIRMRKALEIWSPVYDEVKSELVTQLNAVHDRIVFELCMALGIEFDDIVVASLWQSVNARHLSDVLASRAEYCKAYLLSRIGDGALQVYEVLKENDLQRRRKAFSDIIYKVGPMLHAMHAGSWSVESMPPVSTEFSLEASDRKFRVPKFFVKMDGKKGVAKRKVNYLII